MGCIAPYAAPESAAPRYVDGATYPASPAPLSAVPPATAYRAYPVILPAKPALVPIRGASIALASDCYCLSC